MNKLPLVVLLSAMVNCGCSHYYYVANVQNVPLFQEKEDLRVSAFFGGGDESYSIELQTAYAAGEKVGLMADLMTAWGGKVSDNDYGRGTYVDGAIGYFKPLRETLVFEIYGGIGVSSQHHQYDQVDYNYWTGTIVSQDKGSSRLSFVKVFIQPSLGYKFHAFEAALSARTCLLSYTRIINNSTIADLNNIDDKIHHLIEPALTMRAGWKNIKLQAQFSISYYLGEPGFFSYEGVHLSGGFVFTIPTKKSINPDTQTDSE